MNTFGLLITSIVLKNNDKFFNTIVSDFAVFDKYKDGIYKNHLNYESRIKLIKIDYSDILNNQVYSIEYRINKNNIFLTFNKDIIIIEHSRYHNIPIFNSLKDLLKNYINLSETTLFGFETNLFINGYPEIIDSLIKDKSLYPLYIFKKEMNWQVFKINKYILTNTNNKMENEIESFLKEILGNIKYILKV